MKKEEERGGEDRRGENHGLGEKSSLNWYRDQLEKKPWSGERAAGKREPPSKVRKPGT